MSLLPAYKDTSLEWQAAQQIHILYSNLAREFALDAPQCLVLELNRETQTPEALDSAREWLAKMDDKIEVHQLRQYLQNTFLSSNDSIKVLLEHFLRKSANKPSDRDKIDFLLVQYFSNGVPSLLEDGKVDMPYVAEILKPVLGKVDAAVPAWLEPLDKLMQAANNSPNLNQLFTSGTLESVRKLKNSADEKYFEAGALVAFTRFNFLMRRVFFRLLHRDINALLEGLRTLEQRGIQTLDCRRAEFSAEEPILRLRMICQSWKVMFQAEYSLGQPVRLLADLRNVVDAALASETGAKAEAAPIAKAATAAASGGNDAPTADASGLRDKGKHSGKSRKHRK
jgi:hypothetical protein